MTSASLLAVSYSYIDFWLIRTVLLAKLSLVLLLESAFELEDSLKSPVFCLCMMNSVIMIVTERNKSTTVPAISPLFASIPIRTQEQDLRSYQYPVGQVCKESRGQ